MKRQAGGEADSLSGGRSWKSKSKQGEQNRDGLEMFIEELKEDTSEKSVGFFGGEKGGLFFIGGCFVFIIPLLLLSFLTQLADSKKAIVRSTKLAVLSLEEGTLALSNFDAKRAAGSFYTARAAFGGIRQNLNSLNIAVKQMIRLHPVYGELYPLARQMSDAAFYASEGLYQLAWAFNAFNVSSGAMTERAESIREPVKAGMESIRKMNLALFRIDESKIPQEFRTDWREIRLLARRAEQDIAKLSQVSDILLEVLGHFEKKRYLLAFQNNTEIRPTGGFIGSFAIMDVYKGRIVNLEVPGGGTYDLKGSLMVNLIPPQPLRAVNSRWEAQDANWFPDWPASAEKFAWFYSKSGGSTADGVIALDLFLFKDILNLVGPVEINEYSMTLSADNFLDRVQNYVEFEYDKKENKPKKIIGDLAAKALIKIFDLSPREYLDLASILDKSLAGKNLMIYLKEPRLQKKIKDLGWSGEILDSQKDYLMVAHANLGGEKTDGVIAQSAELITRITDNGVIYNELTLTREHRGGASDPLTGTRNIDYMRVYVPKGSELISAENFEPLDENYFFEPVAGGLEDEMLSKIEKAESIDAKSQTRIGEEFGKTVFANWMQLDPGEKETIRLTYKLPFRIYRQTVFDDSDMISQVKSWLWAEDQAPVNYYSLMLQKQPGGWPMLFTHRISVPKSWRIIGTHPDGLKINDHIIVAQNELNRDRIYGVLLK